MDVEAVLTNLGRWGPWQRRAFVTLGLSVNLVLAMNMLIIVFIGNVPPHQCNLPSYNDHLNMSIPVNGNGTTKSDGQCSVFVYESNRSLACPYGWNYTHEGRATIVSEWDLVCDRDYFVDLSQTVFMVALLISDLFVTAVADYFGRKNAHVISAFMSGVCGIILAFVPNFTGFIIVRFIMGLLVDGTYCTGMVWLAEHFAVQNRVLANTLSLFFWPVSVWLLDLLAYLLPNWRHLTAAVGIISMLPVFCYWLLDESLPWLEVNKKTEQSKKVIKHAARINHIPLETVCPPEGSSNSFHLMLEYSNMKGEKYNEPTTAGNGETDDDKKQDRDTRSDEAHTDNILSVVRHRALCIYSLVFTFIWFTCNLSYYGIVLGAGNLAGNLYLNMFIFSTMEFLADVGILISSKWFGRRPPTIIGLIIVGICLIASEFTPVKTASGTLLTPLIITFVMVGYGGTSAAFADICVYTPEVYPTHVRNLTYGIAMAIGRIGGILAPFYSYASGSVSWVPAVVVGAAAILSGLSTFILPETRTMPLFQTIAEMDEWRQTRNNAKNTQKEVKN